MRKLVSIVVACALTFPAISLADDGSVEESDARFESGAALYHQGKYSEAILEFKRGYDIAPHPIFQVNIALAYAKLGNWAEASDWASRASSSSTLDEGQVVTTAARAAAWSTAATATTTAASPQVADVEPTVVVAEPEPRASASVSGLRMTGYALGGLGVASVLGALIVGATLQDEKRDFESAAEAGDAEAFAELRGEIDRGQSAGRVLLFGGVGLVAVGTVLWAVGGTSEGELALGVGPGRVAFTYRY